MNDTPPFFLPNAEPDKVEETYAEMARIALARVPPLAERIYSISYQHNGELWTATVGDRMHGTHTIQTKVRGQKVERTKHLGNDSTVLAIFAGSPFMVWHDGKSRQWVNPFMAGQPYSVTYFAPPQTA